MPVEDHATVVADVCRGGLGECLDQPVEAEPGRERDRPERVPGSTPRIRRASWMRASSVSGRPTCARSLGLAGLVAIPLKATRPTKALPLRADVDLPRSRSGPHVEG